MQQMDFHVRPIAAGWLVEGEAPLAPLVFLGGGAAERAADDMARAMCQAGVDARVLVMDRRNQLVGARRYWAAEPKLPRTVLRAV